MGRLKIAGLGETVQARNQVRGKLFERLMAEVLRFYGYQIDPVPNVNYAGMEIDIEGRHKLTSIPLYAECKCYGRELDAPKLQAFIGKYMSLWLEDKRSHGFFIALPGVNSHAKGYYREKYEKRSETTLRLVEEPQVLEIIFQTNAAVRPEVIATLIDPAIGQPGDWLLLYTDEGLFWVQNVIVPGAGVASAVALFGATGNPISDKQTLDYLTQVHPELNDFDVVNAAGDVRGRAQGAHEDQEEVVRVRGSSACFEYQFPAAPEYFVGRRLVLEGLDEFVTEVLEKSTSSRSVLFEANSGWGKSSTVLAGVDRLIKQGHFAVAIDSRSASSSQFLLRSVDYCFREFGDFGGALPHDRESNVITGFEGAVEALVGLGRKLEEKGKVLLLFFDQFENVFFLPDVLRRLADLTLKVCDVQTNVILGFSWKSDLVGSTREFPYQSRDAISGSSRRVALDTFSEVETSALLAMLEQEMHQPLRKDLEFFISEFSQGYPWLLKKLCAHVKAQRQAGVPQLDIANSLLNIEELFQEDLQGLSTEQEDTLRRIAKAAPISVSTLDEDFKPEIVQSLINARLVVRIGNKYDIYWDIFRDYLNAGYIPVQDGYVLRRQFASVYKAAQLLAESGGSLDIPELLDRAELSHNSFYNVARDMKLVGIASVDDDGKVTLRSSLNDRANGFEDALRDHLRDKLLRNRLVSRLLNELEASSFLTTHEGAHLLKRWCPYISATDRTWQIYARIFADWMDFADLLTFDAKAGVLAHYSPGAEVRKRDSLLPKRRARSGLAVPTIQYKPVEHAMVRIVEAARTNSAIDWAGLPPTTISKSVATLEDLGFIVRKSRSIEVLPKATEFVSAPERRPALFAEGALNNKAFAAFIQILEEHKHRGRTLAEIGEELRARLKVDWKQSTAETNAKIMLDWARHTELAPGAFARVGRGARRGWKDGDPQTLPLFDGEGER